MCKPVSQSRRCRDDRISADQRDLPGENALTFHARHESCPWWSINTDVSADRRKRVRTSSGVRCSISNAVHRVCYTSVSPVSLTKRKVHMVALLSIPPLGQPTLTAELQEPASGKAWTSSARIDRRFGTQFRRAVGGVPVIVDAAKAFAKLPGVTVSTLGWSGTRVRPPTSAAKLAARVWRDAAHAPRSDDRTYLSASSSEKQNLGLDKSQPVGLNFYPRRGIRSGPQLEQRH